jgi:anti-sigma B factor antagonist
MNGLEIQPTKRECRSSFSAAEVRCPETPTAKSVLTLSLRGELGRDALEEVAAYVRDFSQRGTAKFVLDFSEVAHCDFRGLGALHEVAQALRDSGGDLRLSGVSPYLFAIFQSVNLARCFDFFLSSRQANLAFEMAT